MSFNSSKISALTGAAGATGATGASGSGSGDVVKVGTPVNNQVGVWTGDGTLKGDSTLIFDGDNLGIGAGSDPDHPLHVGTDDFIVKGDGKVGIGCTPINRFNVQVGTDHRIGMWGSSTYSAIQSVSDDNSTVKDLRFDASEFWFLGGNVGIGTSVPDGTCHIHTGSAGSVTADVNADDLVVENSGTGGISLLTPDTSQILFGTPALNGSAHLRWTHSDSELKVGTGLAAGELVFLSGANEERMRIDNDGDVKIEERLGVGGVMPTYPLDVLADSSSAVAISIKGRSLDDKGMLRFVDNSGTTTNQIQSDSSGNLGFYVVTSEKMRITSDGDVKIAESLGVGGIPTAAPLHVFSTGTQPATFQSTSNSNRSRIELLPASGGNAFLISEGGYLSIGGASSLSSSNLNIGVVGGGAGNVGIGTASPGDRLELGENTSGGSTTENLISQWSATQSEGDLDFTITLHDTTDQAIGTGSGIRFSARYQDDGTGSAGAAGIDAYKESAASSNYAFAMRFHTRPNGGDLTERMRITSDGAIGVGGANYGSSGQVLTSAGSSAVPTWETSSGGGKVLQVLNSTAEVADASATSVTAAVSQAITPAADSNTVLVTAIANFSLDYDDSGGEKGDMRWQLFRGSVALGREQRYVNNNDQMQWSANSLYYCCSFTFKDSPATASAVAYSLKYYQANTAGPVAVVYDAQITVQEID